MYLRDIAQLYGACQELLHLVTLPKKGEKYPKVLLNSYSILVEEWYSV